MSSVSGLPRRDRAVARELIARAAFLGLNNRGKMHYTQSPRERWEGIHQNLKAHRGQYPRHADCSSYATWCVWNGLDHFSIHDTVNGLGWKAGYTGTMLAHGKRVRHEGNYLRGDCVIYGHGGTGAHTAIIVGCRNGTPFVVSQGSEMGPFFLPYNYRSDIMQVRRYV